MSANFTTNTGDINDQRLIDLYNGGLNRSFTNGGVVVATTPGTATNLFDLTTTSHFSINGMSYSVASGTNKTGLSGSIKAGQVSVKAGGTGYNNGDILSLSTTGSLGSVMVTGNLGGIVTDVKMVSSGYSYVVGTSATAVTLSPVGGTSSGSGCTIDILAVEPIIVQPISSFCTYLLSVCSSGAFVVTSGPVRTVASIPATGTLPVQRYFGDLPLGQAPIGYINVATNASATFTLNTTATNAAGVTCLYGNISSVLTTLPQS